MRQTVGILGTPIDVLNTEEVLARLEQFIQERRFHQVATANTDFLINALSDLELRYILRHADLVMPDGMPVVWASWLMGSRLPERVTGADIVPALAQRAAEKGYRLYMLGARPEIAQRAKANLLQNHPDLKIVGCVSPPNCSLLEMDSEAILDDIARVQPDVLLVAFGNPKQEKWINLHRDRLQDVPICIGVGGTFDFLAGDSPRAPEWVQRVGLEWAHRLLHDPRRLWRRYARDLTQFSRYLLRQWWALRRGAVRGTSDLYTGQSGDCTIFSLVGDFNALAMPRFQAAVEEALDARTHLILDLSQVSAFDATALGTLINLHKRAAYCGCDVRLAAVPLELENALRRSQMTEGLFTISATVAEAFTNAKRVGLYWRVLCGKEAAVVTVSGSSDANTARQLEQACAWLMARGKRVDLDARGVTYADMHLLATLHRLTRGEHPGFRIIPGAALLNLLKREKALEKFPLGNAPETPPDAVELGCEMLKSSPVESKEDTRSSLPAYAPPLF